MVAKWNTEASNKIDRYVRNIYNNVEVDLSADGYAFDKEEEIKRFEGKHLKFKEISDIIHPDSYIRIKIKRNFNSKEEDFEYKKIFKIVDYLGKEGFNPYELYIEFSNKNINLTKDTEDFKKINSPNDIKKFIADNV